jgi:cell division septum initiation protein DivIVA
MGIRRDFSDHEVALRDTGFRPDANFDTAVRGYDRDQVKRYADRVERILTELAVRHGRAQARERELMEQVAELRADLIARDRDAQVNQLAPAKYLGGRMEQLLAESERLSADVVEEAHAEAERIRAAAREDAQAARAAAAKDAQAIVADAERRAERIVADAEGESGRIIDAARARWERTAAVRHAVHDEILGILHSVDRLAGPTLVEEPEPEPDPAAPHWLVNNAPRPRRPEDVQTPRAEVSTMDAKAMDTKAVDTRSVDAEAMDTVPVDGMPLDTVDH